MKLYTKTGDDGTTGLFGGQRVAKDGVRVRAIGAVDELNCVLGVAASVCRADELSQLLSRVQNDLFDLGADLAMPRKEGAGDPKPAPRIGADGIEQLERWIDGLCEKLPALKQFILPGGSELASRLHHARAVCRRAERTCVTLNRTEPLGEHVVVYLNRLGDMLFAMARRANQLARIADVPWGREVSSEK